MSLGVVLLKNPPFSEQEGEPFHLAALRCNHDFHAEIKRLVKSQHAAHLNIDIKGNITGISSIVGQHASSIVV